MIDPDPRVFQSFRTLAVAAGKDEAAKPMGYDEQFLLKPLRRLPKP